MFEFLLKQRFNAGKKKVHQCTNTKAGLGKRRMKIYKGTQKNADYQIVGGINITIPKVKINPKTNGDVENEREIDCRNRLGKHYT